jgi:uncharacterized protein YbjT (DUF2867 family)
MKIAIFGATGMVGAGALLECLDDPRVGEVLVVTRASTGVEHAKITEVRHADFFDYAPIRSRFAGCDGCLFCLGVSSAGMAEEAYHHLTYDLALAAAKAFVAEAPQATFCYVSGAGTDSTERGRVMWARVKGKTENAIMALPFKASYMLRPGYIQPLRGVRSKTRLYQSLYNVAVPLYPVLRRLFPLHVTTTVDVGRAMIRLVADGYERRILTSADINRAVSHGSLPL